MRPADAVRPSLLLLALGGSLALLSAAACHSLPDLAKADAPFVAGRTCGECHHDIHEEWAASAHAAAFVAEGFSRFSAGGTEASCVPCHAPREVRPAETPVARDEGREDGVTCEACHLVDGVLSGPVEETALVQPHPVRVMPAHFRSPSLCGSCHESTFAEYLAARDDTTKTCQECHMAAIRRKVTQPSSLLAEVLVGFEDKLAGRRHDFTVARVVLDEPPCGFAFDVPARRVTITNLLPHTIPAGGFGHREVAFEATILDRDGAAVTTSRTSVVVAGHRGLGPRAAFVLEWPETEAGVAVEIRVLRVFDGREPLLLARERRELPAR